MAEPVHRGAVPTRPESGSFDAMRTTIDGGGRIVVPKSIRDELGLAPGNEVDIEFDGYAVRVVPVTPPEPLIVDEQGFLVISPDDHNPVTDDDIPF